MIQDIFSKLLKNKNTMLTKNIMPTKIAYSFLVNRSIRDDNDEPLCEVIQSKDIRTKKEADEIAKEIVKRYNSHEELVTCLKEGLYDMKEWRDECVRQVESFDDNERQMMIDLARDVTKRIENAESALQKVN